MQDQKNRGQHGRDEGEMPNRNRSNVKEIPEQDIDIHPRRPGEPNDNRKIEEDNRGNRETGYGKAGRKTENQGQKTVQGKNRKGPDNKVGRDIGDGNQGVKGQNANRQTGDRDSNAQTGKQSQGH